MGLQIANKSADISYDALANILLYISADILASPFCVYAGEMHSDEIIVFGRDLGALYT